MTDSSGWYVHGDISTDHKSANKIEISQLGQPIHPPIGGVSQKIVNFQTEWNYHRSRFTQFLVFGHDPTYQPIHLPTHRWECLHKS